MQLTLTMPASALPALAQAATAMCRSQIHDGDRPGAATSPSKQRSGHVEIDAGEDAKPGKLSIAVSRNEPKNLAPLPPVTATALSITVRLRYNT